MNWADNAKERDMSKIDFDISQKVALITGGTQGIGKRIAIAMAEKGANVVICSRKQENLDQTKEDLKEMGYDIVTHIANVSKSDQVESLVQTVEQRFGKLDILVNNVGMNIWTPAVTEADEKLFDKIIETNLKGPFMVTRSALNLIKNAGKGKIINISTTGARKVTPGVGIYCVAKAGLEMLTKVLAVELAQYNINVNAVAPGVVKTKFSKPFWENESLLNQFTKNIPLGRIAEPEDIVGAVLFLSSDASDYITGDIINVDGGYMA